MSLSECTLKNHPIVADFQEAKKLDSNVGVHSRLLHYLLIMRCKNDKAAQGIDSQGQYSVSNEKAYVNKLIRLLKCLTVVSENQEKCIATLKN